MQASLQRRGLIWRKDFYTKKIFQKFALKYTHTRTYLRGRQLNNRKNREKFLKKLENNFEKETKKIYLK